MTIKELRVSANMKRTEFCKFFDIPYRTVENWERNPKQCRDYVVRGMYYELLYKGIIQPNSKIDK